MPPSHARHLVAEVLDKQIVDAKKNKLGKVDGLVIVLREGRPPRVAYIECGAAVLARRLGRWCERLALALNRRFGVRDERFSGAKQIDIVSRAHAFTELRRLEVVRSISSA